MYGVFFPIAYVFMIRERKAAIRAEIGFIWSA